MNYYKARQKKDGTWGYSCQNDDKIWSVGTCAEGKCSHTSAEEAEECYKKYLVGHALRFVDLNRPASCVVCEAPTQRMAHVGPLKTFPLCEEHSNPETVKTLLHVEETWSSY